MTLSPIVMLRNGQQDVFDGQQVIEVRDWGSLLSERMRTDSTLVCLPPRVAPLNVSHASVAVSIPRWPGSNVSATWHSPSREASLRSYCMTFAC